MSILDPNEVLFHLNQMGYTDITAEQLKKFMTDLKKLIKYEAKRAKCHRDENRNFLQEILSGLSVEQAKHGHNVEKAEVESTEKQKKEIEIVKDTSACNKLVVPELKVSTPGGRTRRISAPSGSDKVIKAIDNKENIPSRPESSASYTTHTVDEPRSGNKDEAVKMWIRTSNRPRSGLRVRHDPVELFHKYQQDWEKFKQYIPGENDHSDLRWKIRTKLLTS